MSDAIALRPGQEIEAPQADTLIQAIMRAAADPATDVAKIEALLRIGREIKRELAEGEFNRAMAAAQAEIEPIFRNAKGENSSYASLEFMDEKIRPIISRHGFALSYDSPLHDGKDVTVRCYVMHIGGFTRPYELASSIDTMGPKGTATKTPVQGLGSTVAYLRRYLLAMIFNVVFTKEDRDGAGAFITEDQLMRITDMLQACELAPAQQSKFLEWLKAKAIGEIKQKDFVRAMRFLEDKLRQNKAGQ